MTTEYYSTILLSILLGPNLLGLGVSNVCTLAPLAEHRQKFQIGHRAVTMSHVKIHGCCQREYDISPPHILNDSEAICNVHACSLGSFLLVLVRLTVTVPVLTGNRQAKIRSWLRPDCVVSNSRFPARLSRHLESTRPQCNEEAPNVITS